jgi:hypothetical protein
MEPLDAAVEWAAVEWAVLEWAMEWAAELDRIRPATFPLTV